MFLIKFRESLIGDDYKFTRLQTKAFIESAKLLPGANVCLSCGIECDCSLQEKYSLNSCHR